MLKKPITLLLFAVLTTGCLTTKPRSARPGEQAAVLEGIPLRSWGDNTCGAGALSTVLNYYGLEVTEDELNSVLAKGRHGGVVSVDLLLESRNRGFAADLVKGDVEAVREAIAQGIAPILMLRVVDAPGNSRDLFHYVVADGVDPVNGRVRLQFGDSKARWVRLEKLDRAWAGGGYATLLVSREQVARASLEEELKRAVALEHHGDRDMALALYRRLAAEYPESAIVLTNLGNALLGAEDLQAAEDAYRRAIAIDPHNRDALNNLAWTLLQRRELLEAEELARGAIALGGPDIHVVLDTLGTILLARGACNEAEEVFRLAIDKAPAEEWPELEAQARLAAGPCLTADARRPN
jgi:Tfp pilus assembly protein PilF